MLAKLDTDKLFFKWLPAGLLACGIVLIYLQIEFNLEYTGHFGIGFVGLSILMHGAIEIVRYFIARANEVRKPNKEKKLNAVMVFTHSAALLMIGAALVVYALLFIAGLADELLLYIRQRPGIAWLYFGVLGIAFSVSTMLRTRGKQRGLILVLASLPNAFFFLIVLLFGLAASLLGLIEISFPIRYQQILTALSARMSAWLY